MRGIKMFSKPRNDPRKLSDETLQQELATLETRHKQTQKIGLAIFLLGLAACVGAGGALGFVLLGALPGGAAAGAAILFGAPVGGLLGMEVICGVSEKIRDGYRARHEFRQYPLAAESEQRAVRRAAEEEEMKKPLDSKAREAFIRSLSDGTKDTVDVLKPLRLTKNRARFAPLS